MTRFRGRWQLGGLALAMALGVGLAPSAVAGPLITGFSTGLTAFSNPFEIAVGPDGNMWFTELNGNRIGRITPAGVITEFSAGLTAASLPAGITAGPDGNLWFAESNRIGRITPAGVITEFTGGGGDGITAGPDGNIWFAGLFSNAIGRITTAGVISLFTTGITANSNPTGITAGPDGNLWFTEGNANRIGRITPAGAITEFPAGAAFGNPLRISAGPDGNLWYTKPGGSAIGRITTAGVVTEFMTGITLGSAPSGITTGPDGTLWFTEQFDNRVGQITTAGVVVELSIPSPGGGLPFGITAGPGGIWFVEQGGRIGRVRVTGEPGDVDGDGKADIVTGAGAGGGPHVEVFGAGGQVLRSFFPYDPAFTGGVRVASCDITGDGVAEIVTAAGPGGGPHVRVFDGKTGVQLPGLRGSFFAYAPAFTGGVFVSCADVNGDGVPDIITGPGPGGGPHVRAFSGTDGTDIGGFFAYAPAFTGGVFVGP